MIDEGLKDIGNIFIAYLMIIDIECHGCGM